MGNGRLGSSPDWIGMHDAPGFIGQDVAVLYVSRCHAKSEDRKEPLGSPGRSFWDESWEGSPNPLENESFPEVSFTAGYFGQQGWVGTHGQTSPTF